MSSARRQARHRDTRGRAREDEERTSGGTGLQDEGALEELLSRPGKGLVDFIRTVASPLVILGAGGKMGPTLARLAKRAAELAGHKLEVIAVSRFPDRGVQRCLEGHEVRVVKADLLDPNAVRGLPDAANVISLVGLKFGTEANPAMTWAVNALVPLRVMERYSDARLVVLSTGNVYPMVPVKSGGAREEHPLTPLGEYANATVARERIYQYLATNRCTRIAILRLTYAVELRYGVVHDIARKVHSGEPIALANGAFNCIWQGDANDMILRALDLASSPPGMWNLTAPHIHRVRAVARRLGVLLGRAPRFTGREQATAFLINSERLCGALGAPATDFDTILQRTAAWVKSGGVTWNKPTHFDVRDGKY